VSIAFEEFLEAENSPLHGLRCYMDYKKQGADGTLMLWEVIVIHWRIVEHGSEFGLRAKQLRFPIKGLSEMSERADPVRNLT
jgi:hypothetical protein